jgi:4-hydroxy-3-methylbut-2-enyl diphosphate reductase
MEILLANPRGFCAGVDRAIEIVETALQRFGAPVYVRHEIVHNRHVVERLREMGAVFVDEPEQAPPGSLLIFSAHGVSPAVREAASRRGLRVIDATCPLVTKVHVEAGRLARKDFEIVLVGHAGHVEVEGTMGQAPERMHLVEDVADVASLEVSDPESLGCVTQTTLSCPARTTSATRPRTARTRSASSRAAQTSSSWSAHPNPRTATAWSSSPPRWGSAPIS